MPITTDAYKRLLAGLDAQLRMRVPNGIPIALEFTRKERNRCFESDVICGPSADHRTPRMEMRRWPLYFDGSFRVGTNAPVGEESRDAEPVENTRLFKFRM